MPNRPTSQLEKKAWEFAKERHKDQVRKFIGLPYFDAHVQKVNGILKQYTSDEVLLAASLLHDTIEDTFDSVDEGYEIIRSEFGQSVADIVMELTSDDMDIGYNYHGSKTDYLIDKMVNMSDDSLIIKLCDRLQNIADAFMASENFRLKYFKETAKIMDSLTSLRTLNKIQTLLVREINSKLDNISSLFKIKRFDDYEN